MDAFVQLALIEKAKRVFAADAGVMLSFPLLAPIGFTAAELTALTAPATATDYAAAGDFARSVNFLPTDMVATATDRMLWDVYRDVLSRAEVGEAGGGSGEGPAATDLLYDVGPDGTRVESEALKRYRQYRDAWIVAREDYATHKLTGELSQDAAERQHWIEVDEPALRAAIDAAASAWETLGGRAAIEAALQAERQAALRDPGLRWAEWTQAFNPDIDMITEVGGSQYAPTGFSPRNFADQDWLTFDLSASEMRTLVDEAPEELKRVLDDDGGTGIERVSFEYRSVALIRAWFRPEVMTSGIWRSSDADLQLSDGESPPKGVCPAYVSACVFVRNVEVTEQAASTDKTFEDLHFTLDAARLTRRSNLRIDPGIAARIARRAVVQPVAPAPTPAVTPRAFQALERSSFMQVAGMRRVASPKASVARRRPIQLDGHVLANPTIRFPAGLFDTPAPAPSPPAPAPHPPAPEPAPPRDEMSILAFICKRLPKVPDPAPDLKWKQTERPFPLPSGHMFGSRASNVVHNGKGNEADRVSVLAIQKRLQELGQSIDMDGWLGEQSDAAIRHFQRSRQLTDDGLVGPVTWKALWA